MEFDAKYVVCIEHVSMSSSNDANSPTACSIGKIVYTSCKEEIQLFVQNAIMPYQFDLCG